MSAAVQTTEQTQTERLHDQVIEGLNHMLNLECLETSPDTFEMLEFFQTLKDSIQDTSKYVGVAFYRPNKLPKDWDKQPKHFNFVKDITAQMREVYIHNPHKTRKDPRWNNFFQLVFEPLMRRIGMFKHRGMLMTADVFINKYITYLNESDVSSTPDSAELSKQVIQIRYKKRQQLKQLIA